MMDRERRISLRGRRDIERERDTLLSAMYRHRENEVNRDRDDRKSAGDGHTWSGAGDRERRR